MASRKPHAKFFTSLALMGALAGVLIWSKLRLSTNMPRSAYADPKDAQVDPAGERGNVETADPAVRPEPSESEVGQSGEDRDDG